ncbi:MAG: CapA family protein [Acidimicrobiaceae bacterium]|nr:CapA family protein [Acidimicrobiaceae bacterium]
MKDWILVGAQALVVGTVALACSNGDTDAVLFAPAVETDSTTTVTETNTTTTAATTTTTTTTTRPRTAILAFTGDLLPHGPVRSAAAAYASADSETGTDVGSGYDFGPMFEEVRPVISAADLAICHFETPLSRDDTSLSGYPLFNSPRGLASAARQAGYDGCSTASNHSFDRNAAGVFSTIEVIEEAGLRQAGMARSHLEDITPVIYQVNGIAVGHLSATYSLNGLVLPSDRGYLVDLIDPESILFEARAAKEAGAEFVIVSLQWGNEYQSTPSAAQDRWLSEILPSDEVDLIVGHHVHVVQPVDRVGDEFVIFGLGNFLSNQSANCCPVATQDGMIALVALVEGLDGEINTVGVQYVPTWVDREAGYVIRNALDLSLRDGRDLTETLTASAARTAEVVESRLDESDGFGVAYWTSSDAGSSVAAFDFFSRPWRALP